MPPDARSLDTQRVFPSLDPRLLASVVLAVQTEDVDLTRRNRPFVRDVAPVVAAYLTARGGYASGSPLHVVLDDDNVATVHCVEALRACQAANDPEGAVVAVAMLGLSRSNRRRVIRRIKQLRRVSTDGLVDDAAATRERRAPDMSE